MTKRISFLVHGEVQGAPTALATSAIYTGKKKMLTVRPGVNYRSFAQKKASSYGLTGWVRNTSNGKVEGEAQGDGESIQKYLKDLSSGPSAAHVVKVEKSEEDAKERESSFDVK